jgi:hypothetical protein
LALRLLQFTQTFMNDASRLQPQVAPALEIHPPKRQIQIVDSFLDHRHFVVNGAQQLGDTLIRGLIELGDETLHLLGQGFLGQLPQAFQVSRDIYDVGTSPARSPECLEAGVTRSIALRFKDCLTTASVLALRREFSCVVLHRRK